MTQWDDERLSGLAAGLPDGIGVLGPDGAITWANHELARMLGLSVDELIGSSGLDLIHPDELARALDGIAFSSQFPDRTAVVPYRIRRGDGTWLPVELKSRPLAGPDGESLVLVLRDGTSRTTLAGALASVAGSHPLAETARLLARAVAGRWPGTGVAVTFVGQAQATRPVPQPVDGTGGWDESGAHRGLVAHDLPDDLAAWATRAFAELPWTRAAHELHVVVADAVDLPPALAADAARLGFGACAVAPVVDPSGEPACLIVWFDEPMVAHLEFGHAITEVTELLALALERRFHLRQLHDAARHDPLTGLPNRMGFFEQLESDLLMRAAHPDQVSVALLFIDLDGFKPVNDKYGHGIGDRLLVEVAHRLARAARPGDIVARLGGDEFSITARFDAQGVRAGATLLADGLVAALREPVMVGGGDGELVGPLRVGASIGIALVDGQVGAEAILDRADAAMYQAKTAGGARSCVWHASV